MANTPTGTMKIKSAQSGFTLVELISVLVLIAIISLVVVPRFTGSSGFAEYAMQQRLVSALRNMQQKAMYDTRANFCYRTIFNTTNNSARFGPTTNSYVSGQEAASCGNSISANSPSFLSSDVGEIDSEDLVFTALDNATSITFLQFDNIGRPISSAGTCASGCKLGFVGESTVSVCIESQGYVYACD